MSQPEIPQATTGVAIVEDDTRYRGFLRAILEGTPGFHCAGAYGSADMALKLLDSQPPDLLLLDLELPGTPGESALGEFRRVFPAMPVVVLTFHQDPRRLFATLEAGASGYLVKPVEPARLVEALIEVRDGGAPMSGPIARLVLESFRKRGGDRKDLETLTAREIQVLQEIAKGALPEEAAARLEIARRTVQTHLRNIYEKLHVHSRSQAVARFLERRAAE